MSLAERRSNLDRRRQGLASWSGRLDRGGVTAAAAAFVRELDPHLELRHDPGDEPAQLLGVEQAVTVGVRRREGARVDPQLGAAEHVVAGRRARLRRLVILLQQQADRAERGVFGSQLDDRRHSGVTAPAGRVVVGQRDHRVAERLELITADLLVFVEVELRRASSVAESSSAGRQSSIVVVIELAEECVGPLARDPADLDSERAERVLGVRRPAPRRSRRRLSGYVQLDPRRCRRPSRHRPDQPRERTARRPPCSVSLPSPSRSRSEWSERTKSSHAARKPLPPADSRAAGGISGRVSPRKMTSWTASRSPTP